MKRDLATISFEVLSAGSRNVNKSRRLDNTEDSLAETN
jgi:hypothetical protein